MNSLRYSMTRLLAGLVVASLAGCSVDEIGKILCKDNTNCPVEYPTCSSSGLCVASAPAASLAVASGADQVGVAGEAVALPLVVKVSDTSSNPFEGQAITWAIAGGNDAAIAQTPSSTTSGPDGKAQVVATLGTKTGTYSVTATSAGVTPGTATFTLTAVGGPATSLTVTGPQSVVAGVAQTYTVTAFDKRGNIATGYTGRVTLTSSDAQATLPAAYT